MRELEFTIKFERGADDIMDLFMEYESLRARSTSCFANDYSMWRVDHVVGPEEALERLDPLYLDETVCNECLDDRRCDSHREYQVLDEGPEYRLVYTRRDEIERCHSIPYLAVDHVGDGVLQEAERRGREYVWRLLMPEACRVGELYDDIEANLRPGLRLELGHVSEPRNWIGSDALDADLSVDERRVLEYAVAEGYYRTPRETTISELSEDLDVPRSTVQYRLQRAEQHVIEHAVETWL